jgi:hypothetical protein
MQHKLAKAAQRQLNASLMQHKLAKAAQRQLNAAQVSKGSSTPAYATIPTSVMTLMTSKY